MSHSRQLGMKTFGYRNDSIAEVFVLSSLFHRRYSDEKRCHRYRVSIFCLDCRDCIYEQHAGIDDFCFEVKMATRWNVLNGSQMIYLNENTNLVESISGDLCLIVGLCAEDHDEFSLIVIELSEENQSE